MVGSGIAGLSTAIALAGRRDVVVVAKQDAGGGSTELAQGGIAAAVGPGDSAAAHAADTVRAAAGLGDPQVAQAVTAEAGEVVALLARLGVRFDRDGLAREGGHGAARVVHARGDATGAEITRALLGAARARRVPVVPGIYLVGLLKAPGSGRVEGALVWDAPARALHRIYAGNVVLATGGYGQLWAGTTSPRVCSGDGLAAALRAGAEAADLEFVQFHPTGMVLGTDPRPLASEALRGAGARLRDASGEYLHGEEGPGLGDLAPRDVVSRSMAGRMAQIGADHCFLDATMLAREGLAHRFPTFVAACRAAGLDPERQWVPVAPTAHYTMGGILTDTDGRTTVEGLMAVGEVGCSGLHGANRLASNSLLEGAVIGRRAAQVLLEGRGPVAPRPPVELEDEVRARPAGAPAPLGRDQLRAAMDRGAGVARDGLGLARLEELLSRPLAPGPIITATAPGLTAPGPTAPGGWELANMVLVARALVALAARRCESRGAHWRRDYPATNPDWRLRQVVGTLDGEQLAVGFTEVGQVAAPDDAGAGLQAVAGRGPVAGTAAAPV